MVSIGLTQAYEFRDGLYRLYAEEVTKPDCDKKIACQLMSAWSIADERIRIHRGKPLPGALKPEPKVRARVVQTHIIPLELEATTSSVKANELTRVATDIITPGDDQNEPKREG